MDFSNLVRTTKKQYLSRQVRDDDDTISGAVGHVRANGSPRHRKKRKRNFFQPVKHKYAVYTRIVQREERPRRIEIHNAADNIRSARAEISLQTILL